MTTASEYTFETPLGTVYVRKEGSNKERIINEIAKKMGRILSATARDVAAEIGETLINRSGPSLEEFADMGHPFRQDGGEGYGPYPLTNTFAQGVSSTSNPSEERTDANPTGRNWQDLGGSMADFPLVVGGYGISKEKVSVKVWLNRYPIVKSKQGEWNLQWLLHKGTPKMKPRPFLHDGARMFTEVMFEKNFLARSDR